ncbi:MAG TPA: Holliday junction resolvase RuvX [Candidatus Saccharimonadales bacterium]|nr:Holliday junction resolvase RuvX [Candidatus Saccharimonadales bacterium]
MSSDTVTANGSILALDIGTARIGLALASTVARFSSPYVTLPNDENLTANLREVCHKESVVQLVAGLPRNLSGEETQQTRYARELGSKLAAELDLPVSFVDEAVTSAQAETELAERGKPFAKGDIDALAATYILEDYLQETK